MQKYPDSASQGQTAALSIRAKARLFLLLSVVLWGISFPLIKALSVAQQGLSPASSPFFLANSFLLVRSAAAALIIAAWQWRSFRTITRLEWSQGVGLGFLLGCGLIFFALGLYLTAASLSAFLLHTAVLIVPLMIALRDRKWPGGRVALCSVLVMSGAAILTLTDQNVIHVGWGEIFSLCAAFFFSAHLLWLERPRYVPNRPLLVTLIMVAVPLVLFVPIALFDRPNFVATWTTFASLDVWIFLGPTIIFCTVIPYTLMVSWQARLPGNEAVIIYALEPIFASSAAMFMPVFFSRAGHIDYANEVFSWHLLVGGGLIIAANLIVARK